MDQQRKYQKSEISKFAKSCAWGANQMLNGCCIAEEITHSEIWRNIGYSTDKELLIAVAREYAKCAKDYAAFDVENGHVHDFQAINMDIIRCCEEHNWFAS